MVRVYCTYHLECTGRTRRNLAFIWFRVAVSDWADIATISDGKLGRLVRVAHLTVPEKKSALGGPSGAGAKLSAARHAEI